MEISLEDLQKLPTSLREPFKHLSRQEVWLHRRREAYRVVFQIEETRERARKATEADPVCRIIEQDIRNEIVLALVRLRDISVHTPKGPGVVKAGEEAGSLSYIRGQIKKLVGTRALLYLQLKEAEKEYTDVVGSKDNPTTTIWQQRQKKVGHVSLPYVEKTIWTEAAWGDVDLALEHLRNFLAAIETQSV